MITIFNRKELLITYDMNKQSEVRTILQNHKIEYNVKVKNLLSPTPHPIRTILHYSTNANFDDVQK